MDSHTRLSTIYRGMKERCYNEKSPSYALYGVGISYSVLVRRLNLGVPVEKAFDKNYAHVRMIEYKGKVQSIAAWSRELGKSYYKVYLRLYKGWSVERALEED